MKFKWMMAAGLFAALALDLRSAEETKRLPIEGTWQWRFTMLDGGEISPRVRFKTKEGKLTGASRFRAGSEMPVENITFKGNEVNFDVEREYEGEKVLTHYSGKLSGDAIKGKITSKSNGEEQSYNWEAKRLIGVDGAWRLYVDYGNDWPDESRLTLKQEGERVTGKLRSRRGETDIHHGRFRDGKISFEVERPAFFGSEKSTNRYYGKFTNDALVGKVEMNRFGRGGGGGGGGRQTNDWDAVRAD